MPIQSPLRALTSRRTRAERAMPGCIVIKPRRSCICIIWLTLGAETRKCRWMSLSAGALPKSSMYREMKARYSDWRLVGRRDASRDPGGALERRTAKTSGPAETTSTAPSENRMLSCLPPSSVSWDTRKPFTRCRRASALGIRISINDRPISSSGSKSSSRRPESSKEHRTRGQRRRGHWRAHSSGVVPYPCRMARLFLCTTSV